MFATNKDMAMMHYKLYLIRYLNI